MNPVKFVIALLLVCCCATVSLAADSGEAGAITVVVKAHVTKETIESVYVEKIVGNFALAIVSVVNGDGGIAYLKKTGNNWSVLSYGTAVPESRLIELGVPPESAKILAD